MSSMRMGWLAMCVCALAACGDSTPAMNATDAATQSDVPAGTCRRAFEATVQNGPGAGTFLMGALVLTPTSATTVTGYVDPVLPTDAGAAAAGQVMQRVPVTGTITGNQLALTFTLPGGRTMQGTGTLPSNAWTCPNELTGALTGPNPGDTGDWRVTISGTICTTVLLVPVCVTVSVTL